MHFNNRYRVTIPVMLSLPSSTDTSKPESVGTAAGSQTGTIKDPEILIQIVKPR